MATEDGELLEVGPEPTPAAKTVVSLSQVLLAPLDAIFKAQVHAARSFLNLLLQLSYPDALRRGVGGNEEKPADKVYTEKFLIGGRTLSVPTLALVPVQPLAIQEATFNLKMAVSYLAEHRQMRRDSGDGGAAPQSPRPWYLVAKPLSIRGVIAPSEGQDASKGAPTSTIDIFVKVAPVPLPSGLDKLLTTMTQQVAEEPSQSAGSQPTSSSSTPESPK